MTNGNDFTGVVVTGSGIAGAPPDVVRVALAAEAAADTVSDAMTQATVGLARMRSVMSDAGIPSSDLRTTDTSVHVDHGPRGDGPQRFVARLGLTVVVREVGAAGSIVQNALEEAGDTARLSSLSFAHSDPSALLTTARQAAFADALAKAQQFAALAGRELGVVVAVDDTAPGGPIPLPRRMTAAPLAAAEFDVEGGQQEVSASVVVRWAWA